MPRYILDTQYYIDVLRDAPAAANVFAFLRAFIGLVDFHALVGAELLFGAHGRGEPAAIRKHIVDRFRAHRLIVPDAADLFAAGDAMRALAERKGRHPELERHAFWNDVVIAVSCRRRGLVLLSRDPDHERIARVVGHTCHDTFPAVPGGV